MNSRPCILIVDDDEAIRDSLRLVLEDAGYPIREAEDGEMALTLLRELDPGMVVLLDLIMPGMDGEDVLGVVTRDDDLASRHAYVLMTAAHQRLTPEITSVLERVSGLVLEKPFDLDVLLDSVERAASGLEDR